MAAGDRGSVELKDVRGLSGLQLEQVLLEARIALGPGKQEAGHLAEGVLHDEAAEFLALEADLDALNLAVLGLGLELQPGQSVPAGEVLDVELTVDGRAIGQEHGRSPCQGLGLVLVGDLFQFDVVDIDPLTVRHDDLLPRLPVLPTELAWALEVEDPAVDHRPQLRRQRPKAPTRRAWRSPSTPPARESRPARLRRW